MNKHRIWLEPLLFSVILLLLATIFIVPDWISEGSSLKFENPWVLLGFIAVPLVIFAGVFEKQTTGRIKFSQAKVLAASGRGIKTWFVPLSVGLRALVVALVVLALARPQDSSDIQQTQTEGIDIVLTLDVSGSMKSPDVNPSRIEAAKFVVGDFIKRRKNDKIGAVIFAENAYTLCPLTLDYSVLSGMIAELNIGVIDDQATAIGNAVGVSINRLRKSEAKSKTIILLTDGTSNTGNISPEQATKFAQTLGIKIYTILVGQNDKAKPINPTLLKQMAEQSGGAFFKATDRDGLISSFHKILDTLERSKIEDQGVVFAEVFGMYLWPALMFAILDLLIGLLVIRRTP